jgi:hypothetical protein
MANLAVRAEPYHNRMKLDEIGGGRVIRRFQRGDKWLNVGAYLTRDEILSINPTNRSSLIGNYIDVWPQSPDAPSSGGRVVASSSTPAAAVIGTGRHVVSLGFGKFKVYEGVLLTDEPVTRAEAYALAGKPEPRRGEKEH